MKATNIDISTPTKKKKKNLKRGTLAFPCKFPAKKVMKTNRLRVDFMSYNFPTLLYLHDEFYSEILLPKRPL